MQEREDKRSEPEPVDYDAERKELEMDPSLLYETVSIALKIEEVPVYEYLCRQFGIDSASRLSGRRLEVSPFHYAQLVVICAQVSAEELLYTEDVLIGADHPSNILDNMMKKAARAFHHTELYDTTRAFAYDVADDQQTIDMIASDAEERILPDALKPRYPRE